MLDPPPYYIDVPRNSYLYLYIEQINEYFGDYAQTIVTREIWFEYKNEPLKWEIPLGVVYDLYSSKNDKFP